MYHGFLASKSQPPHRLFVQLSEALARLGIASLRIDLPGRGDSEGESLDLTVEDDLAAAQMSIDVLAARPEVDAEHIGLLGISWGGILAATMAGRDPRVAATVLLSTAPFEQVGWKPKLQRVDGRRVYKFVGNLVGEQFFAGLPQLHPVDDLARTKGPVAYIYGTRDRLIDAVALDKLKKTLKKAGVPFEVFSIKDGDHIFMAPNLQRQVIDVTVAWLGRTLYKET
jgi:dienelactone hydrolase